MKKIVTYPRLRWILPLVSALLVNNLVYFGSRLFMTDAYHYNITSSLDQLIPIIPQFLIVYFGCYLFWVVNYCIMANQDPEVRDRFFTADFYSRLICLAVFILFPTTNTRPVLADTGFWNQAMGMLYQMDAADNLLPSVHCLVSWFCCIGLRRAKGVPNWYRWFSVVIAILVFVSTVVLKQHVLIDIVAGVAVAELTYFISWHTNGYLIYRRLFDGICQKLNDLAGRWHRGK